LTTLTAHPSGVLSVAISPDGGLLVSGGRGRAGRSRPPVILGVAGAAARKRGPSEAVKLWSLPDGKLLKTLTGHAAEVTALAIGADGRTLASGSTDGEIELWSLPGGKSLPICLMDTSASDSRVKGVKYSKDGAVYTLPCGAPIPPGAVCTCNCVPGTGCSCVGNVSTGGGGGGGGRCTCVPVSYYHPN
jgi:WD40 repeat protein